MSCSKPVRIPGKWAKAYNELILEPIDEDLVQYKGMVDWLLECGVCDEATTKKYYDLVRPYHSLRCLFPVVPNDKLCRTLFKTMLHFVIGLYIVDDQLEKDCTLEEMEKVVDVYDELVDKLDKLFPKLPSTKELKDSLEYVADERLISVVTFSMDYVNRYTRGLLEHASKSDEVIFSYRKKLSNTVSLYLQGVASEKRENEADTENNIFWRRVYGGAAPTFLLFIDGTSQSLGETDSHTTGITELYILSSLYCIVINDLYSLYREIEDGLEFSANLVKFWIANKEISKASEAAGRIISILNEITKYAYKMIERMKTENPDNTALHKVWDYAGYSTTGWFYFHDHANLRYSDTTVRLPSQEMTENELEEWLATDDPYGCNVVKKFLSTSKVYNDISSGFISARGALK